MQLNVSSCFHEALPSIPSVPAARGVVAWSAARTHTPGCAYAREQQHRLTNRHVFTQQRVDKTTGYAWDEHSLVNTSYMAVSKLELKGTNILMKNFDTSRQKDSHVQILVLIRVFDRKEYVLNDCIKAIRTTVWI